MTVVREVKLESLLELRERVLTPGHPNRPVTWWYDNEAAIHYGMFVDDRLVGCVSITPQEMRPDLPRRLPGRLPARAWSNQFHLHSMAVEPTHQGTGLGRRLLSAVVGTVRDRGGDLIWATARPSAVAFYQLCGFEAGDEMRVQPTNARMRYVWLALTTSVEPSRVSEAQATSAITPYLAAPVLALTPLPGSVSNQDFMVNTGIGDFVLKIGDRRELMAEAWACERIRAVGVAGPEIVAFEASPVELPRPFLLMRRLPGAGLDSSPHDAFVEAGSQLRLVHSIRADGYGFFADTDPVDGSWSGPHESWGGVNDEAPSCLAELVDRQVISPELARRISVALERFAAAVRYDERGVLLHGDLKPPHVFADGGKFVGLIDWGDVAVGDPRYDLARFSINAPGALVPLLAGYGIELDDELRLTFAVYRVIRMTTTLLYELRWGGDWFDSYRVTIEADLELLGRL